MPHRVASFFRATSSSLAAAHDQTPKPPSVTSSAPSSTSRGGGPARTDSSRSSLSTQSASSGNVVAPAVAGPVKMATPGSQKEHSLKNWWHRSGRRASHSKPQSATLDWTIESPPTILYGPPEESTGALVSGQLILNVKVDQLAFSEIKGFLNVHVVQKRPFQNHCDDCANQYTEIKSWNFMPRPLAPLLKGEHTFPFSVLLGGHLPATTDSALCSIKYEFNFYAVTTISGEKITLHHELPVSRTLTENETPHHSIRVFPPTNIAASAHFPTIIHPGKSNTLQLHLNGLSRIINPNTQGNRQVETWKLKRINWRLDEKMKTVAPACEKHSPAQPGQTTKKGALRTETRVIGAAELSSGWKSDYTPTDSQVEMELEYKVFLPKSRNHLSPLCDLRAQDGTEISHNLIVELVVVQEIAPLNRPSQVSATGTARILRMHFKTIVTKEAGGGVSWDNECPPLYNEVPPSPPSYPDAAPSYSISSLDSDDPELANAVLALRHEVAAQGGIDGLPDAVSTGNTNGRNEVLEGRGSTEGLINDN